MILETMGMSRKSETEMIFNVSHEIEEIQDPTNHHTKEPQLPWGYSELWT